MVAHSGELFGYDALLTLLPDMNIGVYTASNGPGGIDAFLFHQLVHYFLTDTLLGEKPWLDKETICTFPKPWSNKPLSPETIYIPMDTTLPSSRPLKHYEGKYEHGLLGKIIIEVSSTNTCLSLRHGRIGHFLLFPYEQPDEFRLKGQGILEFLTEADMFAPTTWMTVQFCCENDTENIDALYCSLFEGAPKFERKTSVNNVIE